jgi:hypothetical protein
MFDELASLADDPQRLFEVAGRRLAAAGDLHKLFDLRLLEHRRRLGLALDRRTPIDEVDEPLRSQLETAYLAACREVGELFLEAGRLREAWMYLRPVGDKLPLRQRLARITPDEATADELIELALYEGVDPQRGYAWLLGRQGTCSAITTLDGLAEQLSPAELQACAAVLVRHVYRELQGNLAGHLHRLAGAAPAAPPAQPLSVLQFITQHPQLQAGGDYHIDASHLASTMRYARLLTEPALVANALEMAEYGMHLPADLQYAGDPPFEELYASHRRLFQATLGREVDAALDFFAARARSERQASQDSSPEFVPGASGTMAVETYLVTLARTGRAAEGLDAYRELVPPGAELSRHAPTPLELAAQSGDWDRYAAICRERNDVLGFAAGLLAKGTHPIPASPRQGR